MSEADVIEHTTRALFLVFLLSMPPIIVASIVGVLVSLVQALTQIQEQTLAFAIKLVAITFTLYFTARWLGIEIINYSVMVFDSIPMITGQ